MSFTSYAQNFEDVMLWRALKHIQGGFYIDVGANDPTLYSVTRAFYERGWRGINVEPVTQFFERLTRERTRDLNLQVGVAATSGRLTLYDFPDSGLSTLDATVAEMHTQSGWSVKQVEISVLPLSEICREHVTGDIHFLKVDVEGAEKDVLLGMDFQSWRPWIVVVEATVPMSQHSVHEGWEYMLLSADYDFAYFDGLNRFYIAAEHVELTQAFALPPNVFDGFVLNYNEGATLRALEAESRAHLLASRAVAAETQAKAAEIKAEMAENLAQEANRKAQAAVTQAKEADLRAQLSERSMNEADLRMKAAEYRAETAEIRTQALLNSLSWRLTAPLRWFGTSLLVLMHALPFKGSSTLLSIKEIIGRVLNKCANKVLSNPSSTKAALWFLELTPGLKAYLNRVLVTSSGTSIASHDTPVHGPTDMLTEGAGQVLADLRRAIARNH